MSNQTKNILRVSEVITDEEINKWKQGDIITVTAGTGAGKSHFVKNKLYDNAKSNNKKILFLIHRINCVNQFEIEICRDKKTDVIDIRSYQSIEKGINDTTFEEYQYIICDEFHYFMSDAAFNKFTDISLNSILNQTDKTRIFMSATGDYVKGYIKGCRKIETTDYELPIEFKFIRSLMFYHKDEYLHDFIKEAIEQNKKCMFFIQKAEDAYELYKQYKDYCLFNCSKHNPDYYKYVDKEKINNLLKEERFEELILITTTAMDAGVNIIDLDLNRIVCDVSDVDTLIQCIGRKRAQHEDDKIHLVIKSINNNVLGGMIGKLNTKRNMAKYLRENSIDEYLEKYPREYDQWSIVYADINENKELALKVNELMYFKCIQDVARLQAMLKNYKSFGYCKYLAEKLGFYDSENYSYNYAIYDEIRKSQSLKEYLESIVGNKLYKDNQKELIEKIDLRVDGKQQKSFRKLNDGLNMIKLPFVIIPKKSGSVRYWIVEKMEW